jgi:hypothetical protein
VAAAQSAFVNQLLKVLIEKAPTVNPHQAISIGATEIRYMFPAREIPGIIDAYMDGITVTLAISLAAVGLSTILSVLSPWKRLRSS